MKKRKRILIYTDPGTGRRVSSRKTLEEEKREFVAKILKKGL